MKGATQKTLIVARGVAKTGKTSSIKAFAARLSVFVEKRGDILISLPITKGDRKRQIGIGSAGDTRTHVENNVEFFAKHHCAIGICAARTTGSGLEHLKNFASEHRFNVVYVDTERVEKHLVAKTINANAEQILRHFWKAFG